MLDFGWISRNDADLFAHTANSYSTLRSDGRHGKDIGGPPVNPMQHGIALTLVCGLVVAWLRHIGATDESRKAD
jgi:hypothetical protein